MGGLIQLFIYTWTCNDIIMQSMAVSDAAYNSKWYLLPYNDPGRAVRKGLMMVMIRARRPCQLTAGNFAVMSLDTFTGVSAAHRMTWFSKTFFPKEIHLLQAVKSTASEPVSCGSNAIVTNRTLFFCPVVKYIDKDTSHFSDTFLT